MGTQLPMAPEAGGKKAQGFCTPKADTAPQTVSVPPRRVLPIIFLPGIMGSNLRMSNARQKFLGKKNNIAWRPDDKIEALKLVRASAARRQSLLDPAQTEVDIYEPDHNLIGDASESADERHDNGQIRVSLNVGVDTPLLMDDPITSKPRKTKETKARERGWGEIYFSSYRYLLEMCEERLNRIAWGWERIIDMSPSDWDAHSQPPLMPISKKQLEDATRGCWFPVHAMGYNWLRPSKHAAVELRKRVLRLIDQYCHQGYQCEKVIIVTHSMGGLVARALVHPDIGKLESKILGVVHGVMPATGAPAAYKRMRCGFEEGILKADPAPKVLGNWGSDVTAVLGNSPGALELLPSRAYGNGWLQVKHNGSILLALPKAGDPYEEIYKLRGKWYGLLQEDWLNPSNDPLSNFERTCVYLDDAKQFHQDIESTYHPHSYAHYGADPKRPSWQHVVWNLDSRFDSPGWEDLKIVRDNRQGKLTLSPRTIAATESAQGTEFGASTEIYGAHLGASGGPGDQTVPLQSAEHQLLSGKFIGIFRQHGYEHQGSYCDVQALNSTLYSLASIIRTMKWAE